MVYRANINQYLLLIMSCSFWVGVGFFLLRVQFKNTRNTEFKGKVMLWLSIPLFSFWLFTLIYNKTEITNEKMRFSQVGFRAEIKYSDIIDINEFTKVEKKKETKIHRILFSNNEMMDITEYRFIGNSYKYFKDEYESFKKYNNN